MPKNKAGLNQVFLCKVCARAFFDRAASMPIAVELKDVVVQVAEMVPHAKYPDDRDLDTLVYTDKDFSVIKLDESDAGTCCADHTALCSASRIRFRKELDGKLHIVGAEYLE